MKIRCKDQNENTKSRDHNDTASLHKGSGPCLVSVKGLVCAWFLSESVLIVG